MCEVSYGHPNWLLAEREPPTPPDDTTVAVLQAGEGGRRVKGGRGGRGRGERGWCHPIRRVGAVHPSNDQHSNNDRLWRVAPVGAQPEAKSVQLITQKLAECVPPRMELEEAT
jgi:hypothetical protein